MDRKERLTAGGWTRFISAGLGCILAAAAAGAAEWDFTPRVEASETYRSNVTLAPDGEEESEWITELAPGFGAELAGVNNSLSVDYRLQALAFADDSDRNDVFHQLDANGDFELVSERLFLDALARYNQQNIDPAGRTPIGNTFDAGNRTDVGIYRLTPTLIQPLGGFAVARASVSYGQVEYYDPDPTNLNIQDSEQQAADFVLGSPAEDRFSWSAFYGYRRTDFEEAREFEYQRAGAEVGIPVGTRTWLLATGGSESEVDEDPSAGNLDSTFWNVGVRWEPTELQSLIARVGERFFGTSYEFHWTRRGSRGELAVDYTEEPTTANNVQFDGTVVLPDGGFAGLPRLEPDVFLRKRLSGSIKYEFTRATFTGTVYADDRDYEISGDNDQVWGVRTDLAWPLGPRTDLLLTGDFSNRDFEDTPGEQDLYYLKAGLARELTRTMSASFAVAHYRRDGEGSSDFEDNSATLQVMMEF